MMPRFFDTFGFCTIVLVSLGQAFAHGDHDQVPINDASTDWATRHMAEEHHINTFDADSFFKLHASGDDWTPEDVRRLYGLMDESTNDIPEEKKAKAVEQVMRLYDQDLSGTISYAEFVVANAKGVTLPDFGYGPGHHGDDEYEYELHHYEKYHNDDTKPEDLTHPEDIAHFKKHDAAEDKAEAQEKFDQLRIVEANIPAKFRRGE